MQHYVKGSMKSIIIHVHNSTSYITFKFPPRLPIVYTTRIVTRQELESKLGVAANTGK